MAILLITLASLALLTRPDARAPETWPVVAARSQVRIHVGKTGLFGFAGHTHAIVAPAVSGQVRFDPADLVQSQIELTFDAAALRVDPEGEPAGDAPKVQAVMAGPEVLDVKRFPTITFRSTAVQVENRTGDRARLRITGVLVLHGVTRPVTTTVDLTRTPTSLSAAGRFPIKQTDFGIKPVSAGMGMVKVKDEVEVAFTLVAAPASAGDECILPGCSEPEQGQRGAELYAAACANCHGLDGRGSPQAAALIGLPIPDFTDCSFATREADADWAAVVHGGGPVRGFDRLMPAFGEALPDPDIAAVVRHIRTFCASRAWPRGELNLPRALVTEKAYPEDEAVWTTTAAANGPGAVTNEIVYERRFGARNQFELKVPLAAARHPEGNWRFGAGDITLGVKRALAHSLERGSIISIAGEVVLPTGDESAGAGSGTTIVESFVAFGQMLPRDTFVQAQAGVEVPADRDRAERESFWRVVAGRTFIRGDYGRSWTPMVELLASRALESGERTHWDVVPQMQVSLNTRQHILLNVGVRLPMNDRAGRQRRVLVYLLWDWFDGGFFDGW
jgi:polyisoprenoid-binding protein YceI